LGAFGIIEPHTDIDVADVHQIAALQRDGVCDSMAVHGRSVRGLQVLDEEVLTHDAKTRMAAAYIFGADDDIVTRATPDGDGSMNANLHAAQLFRTALDVDRPALFAFALTGDHAHARLQDGEQEQVHQHDQQDACNQKGGIYHREAAVLTNGGRAAAAARPGTQSSRSKIRSWPKGHFANFSRESRAPRRASLTLTNM